MWSLHGLGFSGQIRSVKRTRPNITRVKPAIAHVSACAYSQTSGRVRICSRTASSATWRRSGTSLSSRRALRTVASARSQPYCAITVAPPSGAGAAAAVAVGGAAAARTPPPPPWPHSMQEGRAGELHTCIGSRRCVYVCVCVCVCVCMCVCVSVSVRPYRRS